MGVTYYNHLSVADRLCCYIEQLETINVELNLRKNEGNAGAAVSGLVTSFLNQISSDPNFAIDTSSRDPDQKFQPPEYLSVPAQPYLIKFILENDDPIIFVDSVLNSTVFAGAPVSLPVATLIQNEPVSGTRVAKTTVGATNGNIAQTAIERYGYATYREPIVWTDPYNTITMWVYWTGPMGHGANRKLRLRLEDSRTSPYIPIESDVVTITSKNKWQKVTFYFTTPTPTPINGQHDRVVLLFDVNNTDWQRDDSLYWDCLNVGETPPNLQFPPFRREVTDPNNTESWVFGVYLVRENGTRFRLFDKQAIAYDGQYEYTLDALKNPKTELIPHAPNNVTYSEVVCSLKNHFELVKRHLTHGH